MPKFTTGILDDTPKPRRHPFGRILTVIVALLVSPVLYEGSLLCIAQWKAMYGAVETPKTPVLDFIRQTYVDGRHDLTTMVTPTFSSMPWRPGLVIPMFLVLTSVAALLLRR